MIFRRANYSNSRTISNNITLADGTSSSLRCGWSSGSILNLTGEISGKGSLEIANDQYTVQLSNSNTYSGGTKIGGGKNGWGGGGQGALVLAAENALGTGAVTFGSAKSYFDMGGFNQTIGGLYDMTGLTGIGTVKNTGAAAMLTLDVAKGEDYSWSGALENVENLSIVKEGEGSQTFTTAKSYSSVTVNKGALTLPSGSTISGLLLLSNEASVDIAPTSLEEYVTIQNANFTNSSVWKINIDSLTSFSRFAFENVPLFDDLYGFLDIDVDENANLPNNAEFKVSNTLPGVSYTDMESWLTAEDRYEWNLLWNSANNAMLLQRDSAAVPEPSSWLLLILGVGLLVVSRKPRVVLFRF